MNWGRFADRLISFLFHVGLWGLFLMTLIAGTSRI